MELRDKSDLLHPTDGGDFISHCNDNNEEIGSASLLDIVTVDCAYNKDYHNYDNCDAPSQSHGLGQGLCNVCPPPTKDDGEGEEKGSDDYAHCFNQRMCSICLDESKPPMCLCLFPCQHTFHSNCIFPWLTERSSMCPLCKAMFEAMQCKVDNVGDGDGAATMTMTGQGARTTKGDNGMGASTL